MRSVPDIDEEDYCLIVKGKGLKKHKFTLKDLKEKFPKHEVVTTLQCAGNRREDMHDDNHKVCSRALGAIPCLSCAFNFA